MMHSRHISTNSNSYECYPKNILSLDASDKDAFIPSSHFTPIQQQQQQFHKYQIEQQQQSAEKQQLFQQQQQQQPQMFNLINNNRFQPHEIMLPAQSEQQINSSTNINVNMSNQLVPPHVFVKLSPSNNRLPNMHQHPTQTVQLKEQQLMQQQQQQQLGFQSQQQQLQQNYNNYYQQSQQQEPHVIIAQQLQQQQQLQQPFQLQAQQHSQVQQYLQQQQQQQFNFQPVNNLRPQQQHSGNWQGIGIQHVLEEDQDMCRQSLGEQNQLFQQQQQQQQQQLNGFKINQQQTAQIFAEQQSQKKHDHQILNQQQKYYDHTLQEQNSTNPSDQIYSQFSQGQQFNMPTDCIQPYEQQQHQQEDLFHGPHESFGKKNELSHHLSSQDEDSKAECEQDNAQFYSKRTTLMPKVLLSEDQPNNFLQSHAHSSGHQKEIELSSLSPCFNHTSRETSKRSLSYSHRYSSLKQANNEHISIALNTHKNINSSSNNNNTNLLLLRTSSTMDANTAVQNPHNSNLHSATNTQLFPQGLARFPGNQSQKISRIPNNVKTHSNHASSIISYDALRRVKTEADDTQLQEDSIDFHQNLSCNDLFDTQSQNNNNYDKNTNRYIAKHDYTSKIEGGLSFKQGDIITVYSKMKNGWWNGSADHRNHNNTTTSKDTQNSIKSGYFPCNYVQPLMS